MSIRNKLIILFLAFIILPMLFMAYLEFNQATRDIEEIEHSKLESIAGLKKAKIEDFFNNLKGDIRIAQDYWNIKTNLPLIIKYGNNMTSPEYLKARNTLDSQLMTLAKVKGYLDIELLDLEGKDVYDTDVKHRAAELGKPINDSRILEKGKNGFYLSEIFRNEHHESKFSLMAAGPALDNSGKTIGVIVFEIDMEPIYSFIQDTTGLGKTGETLIVKKTGDSVLFLNRLRHDPNAALVRQVKIGSNLAIPSQQSAMGKDGMGMVKDYRGVKVLAVWRYLPSLGWGMVVKIDVAEAHKPIVDLGRLTMFLLLVTSLIGVFVALSMAKSISGPIYALQKGTEIIGSGNLDHRVGTDARDEIGQLSRSFDRMTENLKKTTASRDELNNEIAERKKAEENMIKLAKFQESDRMKTEFMSVMSHELRTPITPIKGYLSLLLGGEMGEIVPKQKEALLAIQKQSEHLLHIIDSILDVSRMEAGKLLEINKVPVSMNETIMEVVEGTKEQISEKKSELKLDLAKDLPTIMGDEVKLDRVIVNILGNALKFTPKGGSIIIKTARQDNSVQVSIEDSGVGIASENLEKVFEKFYQVDSSYTRAAGGIGMGLTIAREIVEAHGGKIWAESEGLGRGTAIKFVLPIA